MNRLKGWTSFIKESFGENLIGRPISLIRTLHTIGKWDETSRGMEKVTKDEKVMGFIGPMGEYDGYETSGFWLMDDMGKKKGYILYDKKTGEFVDGESTYHYTYTGETQEDISLLGLIKDMFS